MVKLIDSHCHLDQVEDTQGALQRAWHAGVEAIICVGVDFESNLKNLELAEKFSQPKLYIALGIQPTEIISDQILTTLEFIRNNIKKAIAVGEIGLDFWHKETKKSPVKKQEQEEVYSHQLSIAKEFDLPVSIHSRGAWQRCFELLVASGVKKAVFHWYSGPVDTLQKIIAMGYFISATPALEYSPQHQEAIKAAPLEKIFLETDTPVFYGERETGFRSEPKDVFKTLSLVARLKKLSEEEVAQATTGNLKKFFKIQ